MRGKEGERRRVGRGMIYRQTHHANLAPSSFPTLHRFIFGRFQSFSVHIHLGGGGVGCFLVYVGDGWAGGQLDGRRTAGGTGGGGLSRHDRDTLLLLPYYASYGFRVSSSRSWDEMSAVSFLFFPRHGKERARTHGLGWVGLFVAWCIYWLIKWQSIYL